MAKTEREYADEYLCNDPGNWHDIYYVSPIDANLECLEYRLSRAGIEVAVPILFTVGRHRAPAYSILSFVTAGEGFLSCSDQEYVLKAGQMFLLPPGTLTADGCFKDAEELTDLDFFQWSDPRLYIDADEVRRRCAAAPEGRATLAQCWSSHFQDACAAFGMETALMNMISNPEIYQAVDDKIVDFYLKANAVIFEATKGMLDAVIFANDFGSQQGLMLSTDMITKFVMPGSKKLVNQAHSYGIKVIYHSCGAIFDAIPGLIDIGVDAVHPIQATAKGMRPTPD